MTMRIALCLALWALPLTVPLQTEAAEFRTDAPQEMELHLSLHDAIQAAIENNPQVRLVRERVEAARAQADLQLGAMLPNVSGTVGGSNQSVFLGTFGLAPTRTKPFDLYNLRGTITQNLFSLSLIQRWKAARAGVLTADMEAEVAKRDTMATVALLYLEALRGDAAVQAAEANVQLNQQLLTLAKNRRLAGEGIALDVIRIEVQLENEKQRLVAARNDQSRAKLNLIRALGIPFSVKVVLTDKLVAEPFELPTAEEALATALANRVELKAQQQRIKVANLTLSSVTSERLPSLSANGDTGLVGNHADKTTQTHTFGLLLSVPIFDGGQREARIREGRSNVRQEMIKMKDVSDQVTLEIHDSLLTLQSAREETLVAEQGIRLAQREVELARERFRVGVATNLEVTEAQTSLIRARANLIDALFKFNAARVNLARAQGRIEELY